MPNNDKIPTAAFDEGYKELLAWYDTPHPTLAYAEQLDRIEAKLDRLLAILDKDKGLWIAPGPDEPFGHYERRD